MPGCRAVATATLDDAVAELLLKTVTPQQIQLALAAADEVTDRHTRSHRAAELARHVGPNACESMKPSSLTRRGRDRVFVSTEAPGGRDASV